MIQWKNYGTIVNYSKLYFTIVFSLWKHLSSPLSLNTLLKYTNVF